MEEENLKLLKFLSTISPGSEKIRFDDLHGIKLSQDQRQALQEMGSVLNNMPEQKKKQFGHSKLWLRLGRLLQVANDFELAEIYYNQTVLQDAKELVAWNNLGAITGHTNKEKKERLYRKALEINSNIPEIWFNLSIIESNPIKKKAYLCKALHLDPTYLRAWEYLGLIARGSSKAEWFFRRALEIDPNNSAVWYDLALHYRSLDRLKEALYCYKQANSNVSARISAQSLHRSGIKPKVPKFIPPFSIYFCHL